MQTCTCKNLFWIALYSVNIFSLFGSKFCIIVTFIHLCGLRHYSASIHVVELAAELKFHARFYFNLTCTVLNLAASS